MSYVSSPAPLNSHVNIFISASSLPCSSPNDAAALRNYITTYATHPNQLIYDGRVFVSTFAGESCTFGQASPAQGWSSQFTQHPQLTGRNAVYFVPSFFVDPNTFSTFNDAMDGALNVGFSRFCTGIALMSFQFEVELRLADHVDDFFCKFYIVFCWSQSILTDIVSWVCRSENPVEIRHVDRQRYPICQGSQHHVEQGA